eukprot:c26718_g1_i1 orf=619-1977(+)
MKGEKQQNNQRDKHRKGYWSATLWFIVAILAVGVAAFRAYVSSSKTSCQCESLQNFTGVIEDCCCDYETVNTLNRDVLYPLLKNLVKTPFFRYFKVKLWCDCPFWPDDGMCFLRDCSVCECPENEFPENFKGKPIAQLPADNWMCQEGKPQATVDRTLDQKAFQGWIETDNPWTYDDETDNGEMTYVNLQLNPERYTGYTGISPRRIWDAIYNDNVLRGESKATSAEKRVLYRLISGLHSSISIHIAADYLIDEVNDKWGPSPRLVYERVLRHPERVENLYFTFLFVLRAVTKAADYLLQAEYSTGNPFEDRNTLSLVFELVNNRHLQAACPVPFDEVQLWKGSDSVELIKQLQTQFLNISALMDCVGCEKCRLWGKLQILGLGTALKILFSMDKEDSVAHLLELQHNEVIALINLLNKLSESLHLVHEISPSIKEVNSNQSEEGNHRASVN